MWRYEKRLQYPVNIKQTNPKLAQYIMSQYGGPYRSSRQSSRMNRWRKYRFCSIKAPCVLCREAQRRLSCSAVIKMKAILSPIIYRSG